jgi:ABC-type enterochelin transport system substrate-binding protein
MKIHMRLPFLPMPSAPPPTALATAIQLEMQAEELTKTAQQQQTRLKKLFGARKNPQDLDEDTDSEKRKHDNRSNRNPVDFLA